MEDPAHRVWMAAYARDDRAAFARLFRVYGPKVHAFFLSSLRDRAAADELLQATFLRVHQARASYREDLPLAPWLFTIAANVRRDELRRRMRKKEVLDEDALERAMEGLPELEAPPRADGIAGKVRAAVDALPEGQRVVVHLHRFEGMAYADIATSLGLSEVAVRVRASRAYDRLRESLAALVKEEGLA